MVQVMSMLTYQIDERLSLRMFHVGDAQELFDLTMDSKEELKEWLGWLDYIETVDDTKQNIEARVKGMQETGGLPKSFALLYDNQIAGTIGYNDIDRGIRCGTVGYWLGRSYQGNGLMTRALQTIVDYGFESLQLDKIEIRVATDNVKSRALPERLGFQQEGTLRQAEWLYDRYVDHVVYGLLREEWSR